VRRLFGAVLVCLIAVQIGCGGGGGSGPPAPPPPQASVVVSPGTIAVRAGDTQQFSAAVTGAANTAVNWSVGGVAGGNATVGTISAAGLYTAPAALPNPASVTVTATSVGAGVSGTAAVTLQNPIPILGAVNPTVAGAGTFTMFAMGDRFVSGAQISVGGAPATTTFVSSTLLTARVTLSAGRRGCSRSLFRTRTRAAQVPRR
jgi:hypothetical protein